VRPAQVEEAILAELGLRFELSEAKIDSETLELAQRLEPRHHPGGQGRPD
jgi:hypothetical protein